ncbi:exosortase B [Duganella sp. CY42W]|uniref:Exosortase B n=1 Tax=Duganella levis TaxID=2692169 RepID=A0ABW9W5D0_9BURK|nr:exosortase B [Duganella levis]
MAANLSLQWAERWRRVRQHDRLTLPLLVIFAGIIAMYGPTTVELFHGVWSTDRNAHGPIVLAVGLWFLYFKGRSALQQQMPVQPAPLLGWLTLSLGLALFVLGRSQSFYLLEVGSFIPVLLGTVLLLCGKNIARHLWFGFVFLIFMVPLPTTIVDTLTQPLKIAVSYSAENLLYFFDYPVARAGVILTIGQYQLLVADACSGLNSLFTLEALGLLYLNVMRHESAVRNCVLALLIVPISFASNVTRVIVLSLITYHLGDAAGQGFLHGFSGMVLFLTALMLIISLDTFLRWITASWPRWRGRSVVEQTP